MQSVYRPVTLSLFSGAGGLDIGFHRAGFRIVACVEKEEVFCNTLRKNVGKYSEPDCQILNQDIRLLEPSDIQVDYVDFIIGGPPCQSFSAIGRRAGGVEGVKDERGGLFEHYCRLVKYFQPQGFAFENVRGILGSNKGQDWQRIVVAFGELGYKLAYRVLDTADYGVPQHRERLILVGTRSGEFAFPRPTHGRDSTSSHSYISASEAVRGLPEQKEYSLTNPGKYGKLLEEVPPGMNYHYFTKEMGYPAPMFAWRSRFSDFLYKADPEKPVRTIVAQLGAYSGPFHWSGRKFTVPEFKRLQTFPDDYEFAGATNVTLRQIGNSVPPVFAEAIGQSILQQVFHVDLNVSLIQEGEKLSFDARKSTKAQSTRKTRVSRAEPYLPLLALIEQPQVEERIEKVNEEWFHYLDARHKRVLEHQVNDNVGSLFRVVSHRIGEKISIEVRRYIEGIESSESKIRYGIHFDHLVGNGITSIEGTLFCTDDEDMYVLWDAIEDNLRVNSAYQTMFDVYGHFTEPHPIFTLEVEILASNPSPILRFAEHFANFEATRKILPTQVLQAIFQENKDEPFNFIDIILLLRRLRFDVRVHETNRSIPPGYFRCCYPFTVSLRRQVSIAWRSASEEHQMATNIRYNDILSRAFSKAEELLQTAVPVEAVTDFSDQPSLSYPLKVSKDKEITALGKTVAEGVTTIVSNIGHNRYLYSILMTSLVEKIVNPKQDIRYAQAGTPGGYSNRSTDSIYITPFLRRHGLTCMAVSGMESGRNLERPEPLSLEFLTKPRGPGNREAFLGILHAVEEEGVDPFPIVVLLMALDLLKKQGKVYTYAKPEGLIIQDIVDAVLKHFAQAKGNGRARIPVLSIHAVYQSLVSEVSRYSGKTIRPPNRHTGNDKEGWIGDIQIDWENGLPFEAVEVKAGHQITSDMVRALPNKFRGMNVDRYYILSTEEEYIKESERNEVIETVQSIRLATGCQVIINGLNRSLWYYMRLIDNPSEFIVRYTNLIETDIDIKDEHRALWADILAELSTTKS